MAQQTVRRRVVAEDGPVAPYKANDVVGGVMVVEDVFGPQQTGRLIGVNVSMDGSQKVALELFLFSAKPGPDFINAQTFGWHGSHVEAEAKRSKGRPARRGKAEDKSEEEPAAEDVPLPTPDVGDICLGIVSVGPAAYVTVAGRQIGYVPMDRAILNTENGGSRLYVIPVAAAAHTVSGLKIEFEILRDGN